MPPGLQPKLLILLGVGVLIGLAPLLGSSYLNAFLIILVLSVLQAQSWNLFSGYTGYVSLGHGLFYGVGAYAFGYIVGMRHLSPWLGLTIAGAVGLLLALILGLSLLRLRLGIAYFAMILLGLNEILKETAFNVEALGGAAGITIPPIWNHDAALVLLLVPAVVVTGIAMWLDASRLGRGVRALADDEVAATMVGIDTFRVKLQLFLLSAFFPALAGAVQAWYQSYLDPDIGFSLLISFDMVIMTMFGGAGSWLGPILAAVLVTFVKEYLTIRMPYLHAFIFGLLVMGVMLWAPGGLVELMQRLSAWLKTHRSPEKGVGA